MSITDLPFDCMVQICRYLDTGEDLGYIDMMKVSQVCSQLYEYVCFYFNVLRKDTTHIGYNINQDPYTQKFRKKNLQKIYDVIKMHKNKDLIFAGEHAHTREDLMSLLETKLQQRVELDNVNDQFIKRLLCCCSPFACCIWVGYLIYKKKN